MSKALARWLLEARRQPTSEDLPAWKAADTRPGGDQEFPFTVQEGMTRAEYLAVRDANRPMICYVQGIETVACVVLRRSCAIRRSGSSRSPAEVDTGEGRRRL